jgi:Ni/Co efflux regulator RcnB
VSHRHILDFALVFALVAGNLSPAYAAPPEGKGKGSKSAGDDTVQLVQPTVDYATIRQFAVAGHATGYKALPPGIAKNLARGKPLPPGIAKKSVPSGVRDHLPVYPDYEWKRCGTDLVLVEIATQIVAEVLAGILQ